MPVVRHLGTKLEKNHMTDIRPFNQNDVPVVARMFQKTFRAPRRSAPASLETYLAELFINHPWCEGESASRVFVQSDGTVIGFIGVFIAAHATFAAEVGGCQAECGSGSGMAAAALVTLVGGSTQQAVNAASMALQSILGMVCDPVANRVEVPCLGKNVLAASNALACANMALADFDPVIPLDEVVQAMNEVGKMLPSALRCTALAGLSVTKTSKEIEKRLAKKDDGIRLNPANP